MNVLAKDGSMKIQVGANDGQTITIDLKQIDSNTLKLTSFNVNGKGAVDNAKLTEADLTGFTKTPGQTVTALGLKTMLLLISQRLQLIC